MTIQELKEEVKTLSRRERLLLVQYVIGTLIGETDALLSEEWKKELDFRNDVYRNGEAKSRSWKEVKERLIKNS